MTIDQEDRVVAEATRPAALRRDGAFHGAGEDLDGRSIVASRDRNGQRAHHPRTAVGLALHRLQEPIRLAPLLAGPPSAAHARAPAEGRDLDPGVVSDAEDARSEGEGRGLCGRVLGIRRMRLVDVEINADGIRRHDVGRQLAQQAAELALLPGVRGRDQ